MSTKLSLIVQSELQQDFTVHKPFTLTHAEDSFSLNTDSNGRLNVFYIADGNVKNAYQAPQTTANSIQTWTIEDMGFPSAVNARPQIVKSLRLPTSDSDYVVVLSSDNNLYVLDTKARYPAWTLLENRTRPTVNPITIEPFISTGSLPRIAVLCGDKKLYVVNPATGTWRVDPTVSQMNAGITSVRASADFAGAGGVSTWGYFVAGAVWPEDGTLKNGLIISNSDPDEAELRRVAKGTYTSLAHTAVGTSTTAPLLFALSETMSPVYFKAGGTDGGYTPINPFGDALKEATKIDAVMRAGVSTDKVLRKWIEVFATDKSGNLWHVESAPVANTAANDIPTQSFTLLPDGQYVVNAWKTPSIVFSGSQKLVFGLSNSGDGYSFLVAASPQSLLKASRDFHLGDSASTTLTTLVQDPMTSDWKTTELAVTSTELEDAKERKVYYTEVSVVDQDHTKKGGLATTIYALEYTEIDINNETVVVDSFRPYTTTTDSLGKLAFTCTVVDDLSAPTISIWIEGMDPAHRVDIQPSGKIRETFGSITGDKLKDAKSQVDNTPVFGNLTDPTKRDQVAQSLRDAVKAFGPKSKFLADEPRKAALSKMYIHPHSGAGLAQTRHHTDLTTGHIGSTSPGLPFHLVLHPEFSYRSLTHEEFDELREKLVGGGISLNFSWGDVWRSIKKGLKKAVDIVVKPLVDGAKVVISFAEGVWEGVAKFVKQGFDIIAGVMAAIGKALKDLYDWLCYLLKWDDIKATAAGLRKLFDNVATNGQDFFGDKLPTKINPFFDNAKTWCDDNFEKAITYMTGVSVSTYDKPYVPPNLADVTDDSVSVTKSIDTLPSTAMWLFNKVISNITGLPFGDDEDPGPVISGIGLLISAWDRFTALVVKNGISDDLKKALDDIKDCFKKLKTRSLMDAETIGALLRICKDALILLIDVAKTFVDLLLDLAAAFFKVMLEVFNTEVKIPLLSTLFRKITGEPLTLLNMIVIPLAIPVTIAFKVITGRAPFKKASLLHTAVHTNQVGVDPNVAKDLTLVSALFAGIYVPVDIALDAATAVLNHSIALFPNTPGGDFARKRAQALGIQTVTSWGNVVANVMAVIQTGLSFYPNLDGQPRVITAWGINAITLVYTLGIWFIESREFGARDGIVIWRPIVLSVLGLVNWTGPIWHTVNIVNGTETGTPADIASLISEWMAPVPIMGKALNVVNDPELIASAVLVVLDAVFDTGTAVALGVSYNKS